MGRKAIFIGATGQNVGKTTTCLGLLAGLVERYSKVGFIKPVGQQHVRVEEGLRVDKDVVLFKEHFGLEDAYVEMSPVLFPSGFTRDYLDGKVDGASLKKDIRRSFEKIAEKSEFTVVEGTGHTGVGSIVNLNNATVAAELGLEMIIVAEGGLGNTIDQLALNVNMCQACGVKIAGVIVNRVIEKKRDMILEYIPKALKRWGIPLLGCIPYDSMLSKPSLTDFEKLFKQPLISGEQHRYRHFSSSRLVATSEESYMEMTTPRQLVITSATRDDIIRATIRKHQSFQNSGPDRDLSGGLILAGLESPSKTIVGELQRAGIPSIHVPMSLFQVMKKINGFIAKIGKGDISKVKQAMSLVQQNLDFEGICGL